MAQEDKVKFTSCIFTCMWNEIKMDTFLGRLLKVNSDNKKPLKLFKTDFIRMTSA